MFTIRVELDYFLVLNTVSFLFPVFILWETIGAIQTVYLRSS
jgi:hypothetical protein